MLFFGSNTAVGYINADADLLDVLLARIAASDTEALSELYSTTGISVYGFALSILKNRQDAEDVLHDCFLSIYSAADRYRSCGKPMAWIITIAKNLCLAKLRDRQRCGAASLEEYDLSTAAANPEDRLTLEACMKLLTDQERQIVMLHAVSGMKHREIAQILSVPLATVLSKYSRAIKKLKHHFMKGEQEE